MDGKRKLIGITVAVAIIAGGGLLLGRREPQSIPDRKLGEFGSTTAGATPAGVSSNPAEQRSQVSDGRKPPVNHPFPGIPKSRAGLPLEGDPFVATSKAEQAWLDRNGYPNAEQWKAYSEASDGLLADAAASGDTVAKVMLDNRRLMFGDKTAFKDLFSAGTNGSMFALEMLSAFMAGSSNGDPVMGYALSRVVEMGGNYRVAMGRDAMFNDLLNPVQRMEAEGKAIAIYNDINKFKEKGAKGGNPVDPRPIGG